MPGLLSPLARATRPNGRAWTKFKGRIVHPQTWPDDLDYKGKNVVVIGSGATAATLIPAIADECAHVTMLQRSPTYFLAGRNAIELAETLRQLQVDEDWIHEIVRRKILYDQATFTRRSFDEPEVVKKELLGAVRAHLGPDYDVDTHFTPSYRPWRQRIAFVPDGDLFQASVAARRRSSPTRSRRFTETGILLKSGKELEADIIVTATGFNLSVLGDIEFTIDGKPLDFSDTVTYRGMMFTGVPNMAWVFGYFRASWTLRADLVADFVCRLLDAHGDRRARARWRRRCGRKTRTCRSALDRPGELQPRLHACAACTCCRSAATSPSGSTPRTTGPRRTSSRRSTSTTRRLFTSEICRRDERHS